MKSPLFVFMLTALTLLGILANAREMSAQSAVCGQPIPYSKYTAISTAAQINSGLAYLNAPAYNNI
jgi:hypothetical protein